MPTNLRRFSVTVSAELEQDLVADSKVNHRPVAGQLLWIAEQYYLARHREADVLNLAQTTEPDRRKEAYIGTRKNPQAAVES